MSVRHVDTRPAQDVAAGKDTKIQVLIGPDQGPNFALRRFIMEPGGGMPLHTGVRELWPKDRRGRRRAQRLSIGGRAWKAGATEEHTDAKLNEKCTKTAELATKILAYLEKRAAADKTLTEAITRADGAPFTSLPLRSSHSTMRFLLTSPFFFGQPLWSRMLLKPK